MRVSDKYGRLSFLLWGFLRFRRLTESIVCFHNGQDVPVIGFVCRGHAAQPAQACRGLRFFAEMRIFEN